MKNLTGENAPDFTLVDTANKKHSLQDYKGKTVVLAFYPAAFTGTCQNELCTLRDGFSALDDGTVSVLGVSADLPFSNAAFARQNNITFPLLSDYNLETIHKYDIAFENFAGLPGATRSHRAVYVIDANGLVQYQQITENPGLEPDYDALIAAVRTLG